MTTEELLKKTKCAVIIVDVQNDFCDPNGSCAKKGNDVSGVPAIIPNIQNLIDVSHKNEMPVIFIQTIHTPETDCDSWISRSGGKSVTTCRPNSWGIEFFSLKPEDKDIIVNKHRYSSFIHTRLETVLHTYKVETIIVCGVSSNVCVESTMRDGYMLDFNVIFAEDCSAAFSEAEHKTTITNISKYFGKVATSKEISEILG